jgi:predicted O-linked N-acetylglucosamine transferase (SPINDLY family)
VDLSEDALSARIRDDRIDVLFDLAGHGMGARLQVFAQRSAPVQVKWVGFAGSTGIEQMDYLIADPVHVPPGEEDRYDERILRLPDSYVCYTAPDYAPDPGPPPCLEAGAVTFGSFNQPAKITAPLAACWARVLERVPGSRLLLKFHNLEQARVQAHFREMFTAAGADPARIMLEGGAPHAELLAAYDRVDVALDSFPYSGGLTTCEALWMGVPVVTFPGETFSGRHCASHLHAVGLDELVAADEDGYVALAATLAADTQRRAGWRRELRARTAASPLCDGPRFAAALDAALRGAWRDWCSQ